MTRPRLVWICLLLAGAQGAYNGDMRLVGGKAANEGRVEIFYQHQWGTVCDDQWDLTDASVVCRALGFPRATRALHKAAFGQGSGPVLLDELECTGDEDSLADCKSMGWRQSNCKHEEDAGVICANRPEHNHTLDLSHEQPEALGQLFDSQKDCDLTIRVRAETGEDKLEVCAHRVVLAANPEAQVLLSKVDNMVNLTVDSECLPVVRDFIRYLYSRRLDISMASVKCFHKLASASQALQLQAYCGRLFAIVLPEDPSFQTALDLYAYALTSKDPVLEDVCVRFLAWNLQTLVKTEAWPRVPATLLHALLSRSELVVPSELTLLQALDAWSQAQGAPSWQTAELLAQVRFPMLQPSELFGLRSSLSLYGRHEALIQAKMLQALEFHTLPPSQLAQHHGSNLTQDAYQPRLYTGTRWGASFSNTGRARDPPRRHYPYSSSPQYFQTPQHPSFLSQSRNLSWTLFQLRSQDSCRSLALTCSPQELPALMLSRPRSLDPGIAYDNKVLMLCGDQLVVHVSDIHDRQVPIPDALNSGSSKHTSSFPCPWGRFSGFHAVIRPFYVTSPTGRD